MEKQHTRLRKILFVTYSDCQMLDVTGPAEVFSKANEYPVSEGDQKQQYQITLIAEKAGPVKSTGPFSLLADQSYGDVTAGDLEDLDTLVVCGGEGVHQILKDEAFIAFIQRAAQRARRVVSICTGAFILAKAGLLDQRRATTHWDSIDTLARHFPAIEVERDPIYVRDGKYWTSAGVTAGIDLGLALVEEDLGRQTALSIARRLVVYMMRPGGQAQFLAQLKFQKPSQSKLETLYEWIEQNPAEDLSISALAAKSAMSERHFARCFVNEVGITPAKFVEQSRLDHARRRLEQTRSSIDQIAYDCGFGSAEILRRTFQRHLHLAPGEYRDRFQTSLKQPHARARFGNNYQ